jgi:hypothetical protein
MWNEACEVSFETLFKYLHGVTEKNNRKTNSRDSRCHVDFRSGIFRIPDRSDNILVIKYFAGNVPVT